MINTPLTRISPLTSNMLPTKINQPRKAYLWNGTSIVKDSHVRHRDPKKLWAGYHYSLPHSPNKAAND